MRKTKLNSRNDRIIKVLGFLSFAFLMVIILFPSLFARDLNSEQSKAAEFMEEMLASVSQYCKNSNIEIDPHNDPNLSGLIGLEWTEMTSTIGHLDAKRTSIQSEMAATIVTLLTEAKVQKGDTIGLACSGSFPGLMLACLSAAKAMDLNSKVILSLGSSSFGANRMELTVLDIYMILRDKGLVQESLVAVSLGGEQDLGVGWDSSVIGYLRNKIERSAYPFIREEKLGKSVEKRAEFIGVRNGSIKVLINSGGAMAYIETSATILKVKPGLVSKMRMPDSAQQGLIHTAWENEIKLIHLLFIKGLAIEYGIKWDRAGSLHAE